MSSDDLRWRRGARTPGADYRIFQTAFVEALHPQTGQPKRFSLIECVDWVNIIAITADQRVVLIRQYRAGSDSVCLEIPGGMVDAGESAETAARRELAEETGFTSSTWRLLGVTQPNPAIQGNRLHTFLALDAAQTAPPAPEGTELIAIETPPVADALALVRDGTIEHSLVVAAFGLYALGLP